MTHSIISKRPTTFTYQQWDFVNGNFVPKGSGVLINGGAGIVGGRDLLSGIPMEKRGTLVPEGVITFVDDQALEYLMGCKKFTSDIERGLIRVVKGKLSDAEGDKIAKEDMLDNEHIPGRPYTDKDLEEAGAVMNDDGSANINNADEQLELTRKANAGAPAYVKKRELEKRKADRMAKARAARKRK